MADVLTPQQRSYCMSRIRGKDTGPELILRRLLWREGVRYRVKNRLPGRPDIVFPGARLAVFVDGCFWHGCPKHGTRPKTNSVFWRDKIRRNVERDLEVEKLLKAQSWRTVRFWEHEVSENPKRCVKRIRAELQKSRLGIVGTR